MDDLDKDLTLQWYGWLEEQLMDIMKYAPPTAENLGHFSSPRLASLIVDACGLLDSILRQVSPDPAIVDGETTARDDLTIVDYAKLFAAKLKLPTLKSILLISPPKYLLPFNAWSDLVSGGRYSSPAWWSIHTSLKHDWIAHQKEAKLDVAIDSLCALHQIIAVVPEFGRAVLRHRWVPGKRMNPQLIIEALEGMTAAQSLNVLIETKLFVVGRGREKFPEKIEDFRPSFYDGSERLADFFGRW